jgi:hypothetical protein
MKGTKDWFEKTDKPLDRYAKMGRPEFWTADRISGVISDLEEWVKKDDSICMAGFRADYYLTKDVIHSIRTKSNDFSRAYANAQQKVAERLAKQTGKGAHPSVFNKYAAVYDSDLKDHEIEMVKIKSKADAEGAALSLDQIRKLYADGKLDKSQ